MAKRKPLKSMVDEQLADMLESTDEPSEGRMKLIGIAIKKLALDAKLEESEYGDFFSSADEPGSPTGHEKGTKPVSGKRANGANGA